MAECVYCGLDAGQYDEHEECVAASLEDAVDDAAELELVTGEQA